MQYRTHRIQYYRPGVVAVQLVLGLVGSPQWGAQRRKRRSVVKPRVRSVLGVLGAVAVIAAVLAVHWFIRSSKNPVDTATVWAGDFGAAAIAVPLLTLIITWWFKYRGGTAVVAGTLAQVTAAADWLAEAVAARWRREAADRRIVTPALATVRWRWAADELTAPRQELMVPPVSGAGPVPLPDMGRPGELLGSGVVTRLHDEVYARLPHGRLVLIGGPGAGKTGAMILLLLAALDRRASLANDQRARAPVPVWLTLGGWDPAAISLREWAADTMNRDYPALRAPDYGAAAAGELMRSGRVALFLDGLDEMPPDMRALALKRVNEEARDLRVVITSRPLEWELAMHGTVPEYTAVIELRPVRPEAAAAYLLHGQSGRSRERWQQVGTYLRNNPESVAARALDNPLTLSLARQRVCIPGSCCPDRSWHVPHGGSDPGASDRSVPGHRLSRPTAAGACHQVAGLDRLAHGGQPGPAVVGHSQLGTPVETPARPRPGDRASCRAERADRRRAHLCTYTRT